MHSYTTLTDEQLLVHLRQSDEAAFTEIYNRYWQKLLATGLFFTHDKQAAEDIVHDVMLSVWTRRENLLIESLSAYLGTAVKFAVFKSIAREKSRLNAYRAYPPGGQTDIIDKLDAKFIEEILLKRTAALPPKARLIFDYSRKHELTIAEIASKFNLTPKAVEYHMTKALRALRQTLKKINVLFI